MSKRKTQEYSLDKAGGSIVLPKRMIDSEQFKSLSVNAKALVLFLQSKWSYFKATDMGTREAAEFLHCSKATASRALLELEVNQFIEMYEPSNFVHRESLGNRPRSWHLTWLPFKERGFSPTKEWEEKKVNGFTRGTQT